jgi:hypothetical protein
VSILPGIYASQITGHLNTSSFESIATINGDGTSTYLTFSSIPSTYKHLQIRILGRWVDSPNYGLTMRLNGDTGTNYSAHYISGDGSSASANAYVSISYAYPLGNLSGSGLAANIYTGAVIDLLDAQNTNKNKTIRALGGFDANGSGQLYFSSSAWYNTAAVTSITLGSSIGRFTTTSQLALYGIKG